MGDIQHWIELTSSHEDVQFYVKGEVPSNPTLRHSDPSDSEPVTTGWIFYLSIVLKYLYP